jgi:hypothetical protein
MSPPSVRRPLRALALPALGRLALGAALVLCLGPRSAAAQDSADTSAQALKQAREQFGQALALQTAGDWAGALSLLKEVAAVKSTPQVRFNMALCEERLGRLVAALGNYELAAADARAENADLVAEEVEGRLEALRRRIPRITVRRGEGAENAAVSLDGVAIGDQVLGTPMPADPGPHLVEATAPGFKPFRKSLRLVEQQRETVEITLEAEPAPLPKTSAPLPPRVQARGLRTAAFVVGGAGVLSLGASGLFFGLRARKISELDKACPNRTCPSSAQQDDIDAGRLYTTAANLTLAVGAAALAGGVVLLIASGPGKEPALSLSPTAGGAQLFGHF